MREIKVWRDDYRGVSVEINNFKLGDTDQWTFYLDIVISKIPKKYKPESFWIKGKQFQMAKDCPVRLRYDYYKHHILNNIDWHADITYYEKHGEKNERYIQVGCDYAHSCDRGHFYDLDIVRRDAKKAVDSFFEMIPEYGNKPKACEIVEREER